MNATELIQESPYLKVRVTREEGRLIAALAGRIDEFVDFKKTWEALLVQSGEVRTLGFDLAEVSALNSVGIRQWLLFLQQIERMFTFEFLVVGEAFVEAAAVIQNMFGVSGAPVHAFRVPYRCSHCDLFLSESVTVASLAKVKNGKRNEYELKAPDRSCPTCGKPLLFDGVVEEYFSFLNR